MAYVSSTTQLLALATAPKGKFWVTDGMRRSAARDLAERAGEIGPPADRLAAAELFRHFPRDCQAALPVLRSWLRASAGAKPTPSERRSLAALRAGAAQALSALGAPAVEALGDLRAARTVERDDRARAALNGAIDRLERLAPAS